MTLSELLPYLSLVASIIFGIVAINRDRSADMKHAGKIDLQISTIASDVKDIKLNLRDTSAQLSKQSERIAVIERDVKTAFNQLEEVRGDVKRLQDHQNGVNKHEQFNKS